MIENKVVELIESQLSRDDRWFLNVHGSMFSKSGTPDILTVDHAGVVVGIEIKKPGGMVAINQLRRGLEILKSGGRFVIATADFLLENLDGQYLRQIDTTNEDEFSLFTCEWSSNVTESVELV